MATKLGVYRHQKNGRTVIGLASNSQPADNYQTFESNLSGRFAAAGDDIR